MRRRRTGCRPTLSPSATRASRASPCAAAAKSPAKERWTQSAALAKPRSRARAGLASSIVPWAETSKTPAGSASSRRREAPAGLAVCAASTCREQRGAQGARQRDQPAGTLGDQAVGGEVDDLGGDALDRTTRDHQHRTLGPQVVDQPQQIARLDPRQLVLSEDGAETPGGDRARQPGRVGRLLDHDLAECTAQQQGEELAIVRAVVDDEDRRQVAHRPRQGSEDADFDRRKAVRERAQETSASAQNSGRVAQDVVQLTLHLCNRLQQVRRAESPVSQRVRARSLTAGAPVRRRLPRASRSSDRLRRGQRRGRRGSGCASI